MNYNQKANSFSVILGQDSENVIKWFPKYLLRLLWKSACTQSNCEISVWETFAFHISCHSIALLIAFNLALLNESFLVEWRQKNTGISQSMNIEAYLDPISMSELQGTYDCVLA